MKSSISEVWMRIAASVLTATLLFGCSSETDAEQSDDATVPAESSDPSDASDSSDAADPSGTVSTTDPSDASESSNASDDPSDAESYDPCGDKSCGETCQICPPDDNDCVETGVVKACDAMGECVADTGDLCEEADYVPCAGKTCGETCTICEPGDDDCVETTELKACDPDGACVSDTGDLCDGTYEPCAGKLCGDRCTVCAPDDFDCFETDEIKACDPDGQCVSDTGDLCANADTLCGRINNGEDLVSALEWSGGCGDLTLYATKPDRTIELNLYIAGVCEEAHDGSALLSRTYELPNDAVSLGISVGAYVDEFTCNDAILNDPVINETLVPMSGTLELEVTPDGEANAWMFPSMVNATLRDAVFVDGTGCSFTLSFGWSDVYAGWFPGR